MSWWRKDLYNDYTSKYKSYIQPKFDYGLCVLWGTPTGE